MSENILYLSPCFWPEQVGSAAYCTDLALHLQAEGHRLRVEAFRPHYPDAKHFPAWADGARDDERAPRFLTIFSVTQRWHRLEPRVPPAAALLAHLWVAAMGC